MGVSQKDTKLGENPVVYSLSSGNEKRTDVRTTEGRADWYTDVQRKTIIPRHTIVAGYKKWVFVPNANRKDVDQAINLQLGQ